MENKIMMIEIERLHPFISPSTAWGKTTFATKEEAEEALRGGKG